jgi:hypothetical protein
MGPFMRNTPVGFVARLSFRVALLRPWGLAAWNAYYGKLYPGRPPADLDAHRAGIRESLRRPGHWRAFATTTHTSHAPAEARLDEVRAPALVVMGERDPDFPDPEAEARLVAERVNGKVVMVPGAGHYPQAEFPRSSPGSWSSSSVESPRRQGRAPIRGRTGCDRLRPATTQQSLCKYSVVGLMSEQATELSRRAESSFGVVPWRAIQASGTSSVTSCFG